MMHQLLEDGDWFLPKRYGYGAGLPIEWQGWALLAAYIGLMAGCGFAFRPDGADAAVLVALVITLSIAFARIARRHTRGGWRWRWGDG